VKKTQSDAT